MTRFNYSRDHTWNKIAQYNKPNTNLPHPAFLTLKTGAFRARVGISIKNYDTRFPIAVSYDDKCIYLQPHNFIARNGSKTVALSWENISSIKTTESSIFGSKTITITEINIDKKISLICDTNRTKHYLSEISDFYRENRR